MSWKRSLTAVVATILLATVSASAQSVLRIGLNDDPDALDPTISRAYVGRLVFAALCDKLFDVAPDLKIVPQLATGYEWAPDSRSVVLKLRAGELRLKGLDYLFSHAYPNFYFHVTTAYNILRHNGVEIGKKDFLGNP